MIRFVIFLLCFTPCAALAQGFAPITEKTDFLQRVADRGLRLGMFDLSITIKPDGAIQGTALGWQVTGDWVWKDGLFCRTMDWGGMEISYNCQLVEIDGQKVRFTSDAGQGRAASFRLD